MSINLIENELIGAKETLELLINDKSLINNIDKAAQMISDSLKNGGKVYAAGNGGSMCDAMHFCEELSGRYRNNRKPLPASAISDPSYMSCVSNDYSYEDIFLRYVEAFLNKNDIFICFSSSGKSKNLIKALEYCKANNIKSIALLGNDGGGMLNLCTMPLLVKKNGYADRIQECHIKIVHILIMLIEHKLGLS